MNNRVMKYLFSIFLMSLMCSSAYSNTIKIVGSDLLVTPIKEQMASLASGRGDTLTIDMIGSVRGLKAFEAGEADLAIIAIPREQLDMISKHKSIPLCYQSAYVLVNPVNAISEISLLQLKKIFSKGGGENFTNWQSLGLQNMRAIQPVATSSNDNLTVELFKHVSFPGLNLNEKVLIFAEDAALETFMKTNNAVIAVVEKPIPAGKTLAISPTTEEGKTAHASFPTPENIHSNDYPFNLPIMIVYKSENVEKIKPYIRTLLEDNTAQILEDKGFVAVPKNFRKNFIFELDTVQ